MKPAGAIVGLVLVLLIVFCNPVSGKYPLWTQKVNGEYITDIAISEDGSRVVVGTTIGNVYLYDGQGSLLWSQRYKGTMQVGIDADASLVIVGESESREKDKGTLRAYDQDGNLVWIKHPGWICDLSASEDLGRIAVGNRQGKIVVYDREGNEEFWEENLLKKYDIVSAVGMSPDGKFLAYSLLEKTPVIYLLNLDNKGRRTISSVFKEYGSPIHTLRFSGNGSVLLAASGEGSSDTVYLFSSTGVLKWMKQLPDILDMKISSDGAVSLVGSKDGCIYAYTQTGILSWTRCIDGAIESLSLTPQGDLLAAGSSDGEIILLSSEGTPIWECQINRFPSAKIDEVELCGWGNALVAVVNRNEIIFFSTEPEPITPTDTPLAPLSEIYPEPEETVCEPSTNATMLRWDTLSSAFEFSKYGLAFRTLFHMGT